MECGGTVQTVRSLSAHRGVDPMDEVAALEQLKSLHQRKTQQIEHVKTLTAEFRQWRGDFAAHMQPPSHATAMMVREPHNPYTRHVRIGFEAHKTTALGLWHSGQCLATWFHDGLALQQDQCSCSKAAGHWCLYVDISGPKLQLPKPR